MILQTIENSETIAQNHWQEWIVGSGVDPALAALNVLELSGTEAYEYLLFALDTTARRNDGRLRDSYLRRYAHIEIGGWWVSGLDPLNNWEPMEWGRFKPDQKRIDFEKSKPVKYESPPKTPNRVTYLRVPLHIWHKIANRYNIPMPENIVITDSGEALGFWAWVVANPQIPITLAEGEKKAACLLSLGYVAVALPGIWNGRVGHGANLRDRGRLNRPCDKPIQPTDNTTKPAPISQAKCDHKDFDECLHPDLMPLAQPGRKFIILFDYEAKPKTRWQVFQATIRTGKAIEALGCSCSVAQLPGPEKGIDDWVVALGKKGSGALCRGTHKTTQNEQTFSKRTGFRNNTENSRNKPVRFENPPRKVDSQSRGTKRFAVRVQIFSTGHGGESIPLRPAKSSLASSAVATLIDDAFTLQEYQKLFFLNRSRGLHKYKPNKKVNTRYLSDAIPELPASGLVQHFINP